MSADEMNPVDAPVDWSAAAKVDMAAHRAARRIVQLIPYAGPDFDTALDLVASIHPIAWALCADGNVRVVVLDADLGGTEVTDVNWWSED